MNIRMSRPWLHPTTGKFYYRCRLRADVAVMAGRTVTIDVGGESCTIKLGDLVKVSLRNPRYVRGAIASRIPFKLNWNSRAPCARLIIAKYEILEQRRAELKNRYGASC